MSTKALPKFTNKLNDTINLASQQQVQTNLGVIVGYDPLNNVATVVMTARGSEIPGEIYYKVPCPRPMGIQQTGPEQGCQAVVNFKDAKRERPFIVSYMNTTSYLANDYTRQNTAQVTTPTFQAAM